MTGWLYVAVPHGPTFALEIDARGVCVDAPPIARRRCLGQRSGYLIGYWRSRGAWVLTNVDSPGPKRGT